MTFKALLATKTDKTISTSVVDVNEHELARTTQVVALDQVPAVVNRMFEGKVQGRVVVDVNA